MSKSVLYFGLGILTGGAAGAIGSYFVTKSILDAKHEEDIEAYSEHCEERVERFKEENEDLKKKLGVIKDPVVKYSNNPDEEKIENNAGVKRYHHSTGLDSGYGSNNVFGKANEAVKEAKDSKLINDIDEEEFMNQENGYEKQTLDIFLGDDRDIFGVWGYGTDNEDDADRKWGKPTSELIGTAHTYDELLATTKKTEDGIGILYVRNDELKIDFELVIHDEREDDKE